MNTTKLTMKDYIIIYFIIIIIAAFLGGFFLGAKMMETQLRNTQLSAPIEDKINAQDEIIKFHEMVFSPVREYNLEVKKKGKIENQTQALIVKGTSLKANLEIYTFDTPYLKSAHLALLKNLDLIITGLNQTKDMNWNEEALAAYLVSQRDFYRELWIWEQKTTNSHKLETDSATHLTDWNIANLHQKNYIIATIMDENKIYNLKRPEDVTVHIDTYLASDHENEIELKEIVNLLIKSDSILEGDFLQNKDFYSEIKTPNTSNFK